MSLLPRIRNCFLTTFLHYHFFSSSFYLLLAHDGLFQGFIRETKIPFLRNLSTHGMGVFSFLCRREECKSGDILQGVAHLPAFIVSHHFNPFSSKLLTVFYRDCPKRPTLKSHKTRSCLSRHDQIKLFSLDHAR